MALTAKQKRFADEYLIDLNATQAAIRAGYSKGTADKQGPRLLSDPGVKAAIDAAKIRRTEKTEIDAERVLEEIAAMAFYDPAELIGVSRELADGEECSDGDGIISFNGKRYSVSGITSPAHIAGLPENVRRAIIGWSWDRNENFTLKLADKSKALDQLARHLSLYNDRIEVGTDTLSDRLERATRRLEQADSGTAAKPVAQRDEPVTIAPRASVERNEPETMLPGGTRQVAPPVEKPALPAPAMPYRPIMPAAPEPVIWPSFGGRAVTDYDPTNT